MLWCNFEGKVVSFINYPNIRFQTDMEGKKTCKQANLNSHTKLHYCKRNFLKSNIFRVKENERTELECEISASLLHKKKLGGYANHHTIST